MKTNRRMLGARSTAVVLLALAGWASCGGDAVDPESARPASRPDSGASISALRAIGYAGVSDESYDADETGVMVHDRERSWPGYNLYTNRYLCSTILMDAEGTEVARWEIPEDRNWSNARLLPGGDLVVIGWKRGRPYYALIDERRYIARFSWSGEELGRIRINAHHDLELTPDGRLAVLSFRRTPMQVAEQEVILREDLVCLLDQVGDGIECRSLYKGLSTDPDAYELSEFEANTAGGLTYIDMVHSNSVEFIHRPDLAERDPLYAEGNVIVSMRHQDAVMIFRWETAELVWIWGRGELEGPHDATILDNGNMLIFDNGLLRGWSRVIELDPVEKRIVWEYQASPPESFYTASRGSSQRLPNGNTLICVSDGGRAFEVTHEGEVVWSWLNPERDEDGRLATLVRMKRMPASFIEPLLQNR